MAEGGFDERTPFMEHTDDTGGDDEEPTAPPPTGGNVSMGFTPGEPKAKSTPATRHTRMNTPGELPSYFEKLPDTIDISTTITAESKLKEEFPHANMNKLKYKMDGERVKVGIFAPGKAYYYLTTKKQGTDEYQINKSLTREVLKALGKSRRDTIAEKMQELTAEIADYKKIAADSNENEIERNKAREYALSKLNERTDLKKELDKLKKGVFQPSENIEMVTFNENEAARQQRGKEIQAEIEVQETVLDSPDSTPEEKARAA